MPSRNGAYIFIHDCNDRLVENVRVCFNTFVRAFDQGMPGLCSAPLHVDVVRVFVEIHRGLVFGITHYKSKKIYPAPILELL